MTVVENKCDLKFEIDLAQFADRSGMERRELEKLLQRYARELCEDLALQGAVSLRVGSSDQETRNGIRLFRIAINGRECRSRWWPKPILPDDRSVRDFAALISLAIYDCREFLFTSDHARKLAAE